MAPQLPLLGNETRPLQDPKQNAKWRLRREQIAPHCLVYLMTYRVKGFYALLTVFIQNLIMTIIALRHTPAAVFFYFSGLWKEYDRMPYSCHNSLKCTFDRLIGIFRISQIGFSSILQSAGTIYKPALILDIPRPLFTQRKTVPSFKATYWKL